MLQEEKDKNINENNITTQSFIKIFRIFLLIIFLKRLLIGLEFTELSKDISKNVITAPTVKDAFLY